MITENTGPPVNDYGPTVLCDMGVRVGVSAGGLVDALQRWPPLPVPRAGAPVAIVLTRQLQSDGKSSRVIRRWNLCMLPGLKRK